MDVKRAGKLLLVEDEHLLRGLIAQFLRIEGFEVVEAADGAQGIDLFAAMGPFDVVLLDLNLPRIPGEEVCREIKANQPSQPVIICSAAILDSHTSILRELNVRQYLTKPYHPAELLATIDREMAGRLRADPAESIPKSANLLSRAVRGHSRPAPGQTLVKPPFLD